MLNLSFFGCFSERWEEKGEEERERKERVCVFRRFFKQILIESTTEWQMRNHTHTHTHIHKLKFTHRREG